MGFVHSKQKKKVENICDFPNETLLNIFGYLDLHEQFRIRRVNKRFRRVSEMALSETKALQFKEDPDRIWATTPEDRNAMMRPVSLRKMMKLCSEQLTSVDFTGHRMGYRMVDLVRVFSEYECPNLAAIDLIHVRINDNTFGRLIKNNRNLTKFEWRPKSAPIFPNNVVHEKLETLRIPVKNRTMKSMVGRCPNLKQVFLRVVSGMGISSNVVNDFFSSCPSIETLELCSTNELQIPHDNSFWRLPLRNLAWLVCDDGNDSDTFMHQVATSFPRLETLEFAHRLTNNGIGEMAILHELVEIELFTGFPIYDEVDDGLCQLVVGCPKLQTLKLGAEIEPSTLVKLVNECKKLRLLYVHDVNMGHVGGVHIEVYVEVVSQFNGFGENVTIMMHELCGWTSQHVRAVLDELKENTTRQIKFEVFKR